MRIEQEATTPNDVFWRGFTRFDEDESFFQITVDVGNVVGESSENCFVVLSWIEHLPIAIPVPQFLFQQVVELTPFLNALFDICLECLRPVSFDRIAVVAYFNIGRADSFVNQFWEYLVNLQEKLCSVLAGHR